MNASDNERRKRRRRRLLVGTVIGAGAVVVAAQQASAATTATFRHGVLTVFGDGADNEIVISRDAAGAILVNGGAVRVVGGSPTVANTELIQVFGLNGDDALRLDEAAGALPRASLFGGGGRDTLTGGAGGDRLFGQAGNDTLLGMGGEDFLFGGTGHDALTGGDNGDLVFGESGNDRMVWNPGDDTDLDEGGSGTDTVEINGADGAEKFTTTAVGARVRFDRLDPAPFALDIGSSEKLIVNANGGGDEFSATGNLAALIAITVDGGAGQDALLGSNGADVLLGGAGDDFVDGQQGSDVALLGAGADTFQWDPGDGSDTVEGQDDTDTMVFNGSAAAELFQAAANGERLRFTRNIGNIVMDADGLEVVDLRALAGADNLTVNDLSGTAVDRIATDLSGTLGASAGDGDADTVIVNGTDGADIIDAFGEGTSAAVLGLHTEVTVTNTDGADDSLVVNALGGDDGVTATTLPAGVIGLTVDGGADSDRLLGSQGADVLLGGAGADSLFGEAGDDVALMGAGDDTFQWDPGDGSDTVEGQDGTDAMLFFGSNAAENVDVAAIGGRVRFSRDVGNVAMDLDDVETIDFRALGGADDIVVGDLSGTDVTAISHDLRGPDGGGDGEADTVTVTGTNGADVVGATGDAGGVNVFGLHTTVNIFSPEQANDRLTLNALAGDDTVDATSLEADGIQLAVNGGLGDDSLVGSEGADVINGGDGADLAMMGDGDDVFVWNPGDDNDTIEGQAGFDAMAFNGANVNENIDIAAVGERVRFFRDIADVTMDLNDVERIDFDALGGADTVVANDLSGTDVVQVNADLAAVGGAGDAQPDNVIVQGTDGDDVVLVAGDASGVSTLGLAAEVNITGGEAANDRITVNARAGDDVVDASALRAGAIQLTADGGEGNDVVLGGEGGDVLIGGPGDDVLLGGPGLDVLDGGDGDNVVIQFVGGGDDIEIQGLAGDTVTSAAPADADWLAQHVRIVDGTTVIDVGGKERALPNADLSPLVRQAPGA